MSLGKFKANGSSKRALLLNWGFKQVCEGKLTKDEAQSIMDRLMKRKYSEIKDFINFTNKHTGRE